MRPFTHIMSVQAWVPLRKLCVGGLFRDFQKAETSAQKTGGCLCVCGGICSGDFKKEIQLKKRGVLILIPVTRIFWVVSPSEFLVITGNMFSSIPTKVFIWNPGILGFGR